MPLSVLLVDPQPFFCESVATAMRPLGVDIEWTSDEKAAERLVEERSPDYVLTELQLADGSGFNLTRSIADRARAIVLTRRPEGEVLFDALEAGAAGVIGHATGLSALGEILTGSEGRSWICDEGRLRDSLRLARDNATQRGGTVGRLARLTVREREVLQLLARGMSRDEIARSLYLSEHTVRTHLGNVLKKLKVHSQAEAARVALRGGLAASEVHVVRIAGPDLPER